MGLFVSFLYARIVENRTVDIAKLLDVDRNVVLFRAYNMLLKPWMEDIGFMIQYVLLASKRAPESYAIHRANDGSIVFTYGPYQYGDISPKVLLCTGGDIVLNGSVPNEDGIISTEDLINLILDESLVSSGMIDVVGSTYVEEPVSLEDIEILVHRLLQPRTDPYAILEQWEYETQYQVRSLDRVVKGVLLVKLCKLYDAVLARYRPAQCRPRLIPYIQKRSLLDIDID
jgi:hypothetical protein